MSWVANVWAHLPVVSTLVMVVPLSLPGPRPLSVIMVGVAAVGRAPRPTPRVAVNFRHSLSTTLDACFTWPATRGQVRSRSYSCVLIQNFLCDVELDCFNYT